MYDTVKYDWDNVKMKNKENCITSKLQVKKSGELVVLGFRNSSQNVFTSEIWFAVWSKKSFVVQILYKILRFGLFHRK